MIVRKRKIFFIQIPWIIKLKNLLKMNNESSVNQINNIAKNANIVEEEKNPTLEWKGSSNQRVIDVQKSLKENKIILK